MTGNRVVANSTDERTGKSLSHFGWLWAHDPLVAHRNPVPPKAPPVPAARDFLQAVRKYLGKPGGEISQDYLADWIKADRSMVGRWEMEEGKPSRGDPSWPYIGRILVLLGVWDDSENALRVPTYVGQVQRPMGIPERVLAALSQLPQEEQLDVLQDVTRRAHEAAASQAPAALKKG